MSRVPDFLIIGAMKCGTTSLHDYLNMHPDIFMTKQKEIHYFTNDNFSKFSLSWYKEHFSSDRLITGSSPQNYTKRHNPLFDKSFENLSSTLPKIKLIYIIRNPVDRVISHIMESFYGLPKHMFNYAYSIDNFIKTSMYNEQILPYANFYGKNSILIIHLEDLRDDRMNTLNKVFDFLGVSRLSDPALFEFISNSRESKNVPLRWSKYANLMNGAMRSNFVKSRVNVILCKVADRRIKRVVSKVLTTRNKKLLEKDYRNLMINFSLTKAYFS